MTTEIRRASTSGSSRWSAPEAVGCVLGCELLLSAGGLLTTGLVTGSTSCLTGAGTLAVAGGIAATVCLALRRERIDAQNRTET
ncbi:hypothetical protein [Kitasatospora sp. NPDC058218]|uniref:hypothetical protein n=1 Tax=Kitasatospora sp. NPDC058218 TaxID=3346385 RepID=UPI0036DF791B